MIKMIENVKKLEKALRENQELAAKFEAELRRIAKEKDAANDGEAFVKAAKAVGFDITVTDLEKASAETQELDAEEMEKGAGGWCWADYDCYTALHHNTPDEKGTACWSDYDCKTVYHNSEVVEEVKDFGETVEDVFTNMGEDIAHDLGLLP